MRETPAVDFCLARWKQGEERKVSLQVAAQRSEQRIQREAGSVDRLSEPVRWTSAETSPVSEVPGYPSGRGSWCRAHSWCRALAQQ